MDTGNQLRLSGEGAAGENGAPAGDLYVVIHVKEHISLNVMETTSTAKCQSVSQWQR